MKLLVTGATRGLGRLAVETLLARGVDVRATGRNHVAGEQLRAAGAEFIAADLVDLDRDALHGLVEGCDAIWHCAAESSPWGARALFEAINVRAATALMRAAGDAGVRRFVHVSTPSLYFDFTHRHDVEESWRARVPANEYIRSKMRAEDALTDIASLHPHTCYVVLRPRALFGPHDHVLVPRLLHLLHRGRGVLNLPRGGEALQDATYAGNVVHAMWLASHADVASGRCYNITNHEPTRVRDLIQPLLERELGESLRVRAVPHRVAAIAARVMEWRGQMTSREPLLTRYTAGAISFDMTLSAHRARAELGYIPPISLDDGIRLTGEWFRRHGHTTHH